MVKDVSMTREATVPSSAGGETEKKNVEINDRGVAEPSEAVGAGVNQNNVTSVVPETKSKEPNSVVGGGEHQNADRENARAELKERKAAGSSDGAAAGENQKSPKAVQLEVESIKDVVAGTSKVKETAAGKTEGESPSQCTSNKDEILREETALVQVSDTSVVGEVELSEPVWSLCVPALWALPASDYTFSVKPSGLVSEGKSVSLTCTLSDYSQVDRFEWTKVTANQTDPTDSPEQASLLTSKGAKLGGLNFDRTFLIPRVSEQHAGEWVCSLYSKEILVGQIPFQLHVTGQLQGSALAQSSNKVAAVTLLSFLFVVLLLIALLMYRYQRKAMSKKQSHLQEAIWELIHTELTYMKKLRVITDVDPELLFSNIPQIICAHRTFWQEVISPLLQEVRQTRKPFDPQRLHDGFQTWAETHKQCNRMRLSDMLARPHQRITKYPLMLKSILKRTEASATRDSLVSMVSSVESFLHHINSLLQHKEELQKLSVAAGRIEGYEVLESVSEEEFCQLDLTNPMVGVGPHHIRQLLLEDSLKIREGKDSKVEVHAFLFSDVLLFTKLSKKSETAKVTQAPVLIDRAVCRALKDSGIASVCPSVHVCQCEHIYSASSVLGSISY
ncbi:UNVERIFIED_CONTAM: hypothetical protein FKN15_015706 [Acipenser sinensis]